MPSLFAAVDDGAVAHRVAISNSRLIALDNGRVTFKVKDYRTEGPDRYKTMTLDAAEFIRRFLIHVLPKGFHRIRHYGQRARLEALIGKGKHPAATILKARMLLKADASEAGEGWSDSCIVRALDTSPATVARTRQRLVEEGFDAVLTRKHSANSARKRIFDGAAEAKLIALACSEPPKGRMRWTLALLEDNVVELKIVERASDNTIGRVLKKTRSSRI